METAYDPKTGQWFDVYGDDDRKTGEWGHWTGRAMNWNSMCASCHNTRVKKNYSTTTDTYRTTMAEMGVGCEACHGPLRDHALWRKQYPDPKLHDPTIPKLTRSQTQDACASCHARRDDLTGDFVPGDSFYDHYSLEIPGDSDRWYADNQVRGEDYEYASFLGSRMMNSGVHCRDCHRADSGKGNAMCLKCHQGGNTQFPKAPVISLAAQSHHAATNTAVSCAACHMPVTVFMQRHPRHDHAFVIPDPLLTKEIGVPNACNRCHTNQTPEWAAGFVDKWYGDKMRRYTRERARWIAAARLGQPSARDNLMTMLSTNAEPPYWRAVAAGYLWQWIADPGVKDALLRSLRDDHPLVREKTIRSLEQLAEDGDAATVSALRSLLNDPVRCVRVTAAWALKSTVDLQSGAGRELAQALDYNADQPAGQFRKAQFHLARQQPKEALACMRKAVAWDPYSPPLRLELAAVLGRTGRLPEAVDALAEADRLAPNNPQILTACASALFQAGKVNEARKATDQALSIVPSYAPAMNLLRKMDDKR